MMRQSFPHVQSRMELAMMFQELGGSEFGLVSSSPTADAPSRLFFASVGTGIPATCRILVYEQVGTTFHRLDDFVYDERTLGSVYQAERVGDVIRFFSGKGRQLRMERKIQVVAPT